MRSAFYRVAPIWALRATHEWYCPTEAELDAECRKSPQADANWIREHVSKGGLLIRPIEQAAKGRRG